MQKVISVTETRKMFPDFEGYYWKARHPECKDPESVALGNPKFCTVRHVVVVDCDEKRREGQTSPFQGLLLFLGF